MTHHSALLEEFRATWPVAPYPMVVERRGEGERICPAASLWSGGRDLARGLGAMGVRAGDRVAVLAPPGIAWVRAWLACLRVGAAFVPIPPTWPRAWREAAVQRAAPRALVEADERIRSAPGGEIGLPAGAVWCWPAPPVDAAPEVLDESALVARLRTLAASICPVPALRLVARGDGADPASLLGEWLGALAGGAEIAVGDAAAGEAADRLVAWREADATPPAPRPGACAVVCGGAGTGVGTARLREAGWRIAPLEGV